MITVNSPVTGIDGAAASVQHSPIVVPAWQDVAIGSKFVTELEARGWPSGIPYHLIFSYAGNSNGDGTVPLSSQLPLVLRAEATRTYGLEGDHVGTLSSQSLPESPPGGVSGVILSRSSLEGNLLCRTVLQITSRTVHL